MKPIIGFSEFLLEIDVDRLSKFEINFAQSADSNSLLTYAKEFSASNKRLILRHIVDKRTNIKDDQNLVEFIRAFPEFKSLMPML